ncbi:MAG: PQQ-binding-like beta-propeller repeat protein [Verrucomicrobiota bacterium]
MDSSSLLVAFVCALVWLAFTPLTRAQPEGTLKWSGPFVTGGFIVSSPAVGPDGTLYIGSQDKYLYAVAPTGALKWRFLTGDWVDASPTIAPDGTVYVGSWDGKLYALTPTGTKKWEYSTGAGNYIYSSPALAADGTIYFGAGDGNFYALRPDGSLKWTYPAADWIDSSPAIGPDGLIYFGSWDASVYALRDEDTHATEVWRQATGGPILASPAVGRNGAVYVGSNDGKLYAFDSATGVKRWDYFAEGTIESSPALGPDGTIYFGNGGSLLHALTPEGTRKWRYFTQEPIVSTPAVRSDGTILFGSGAARIYALNPDATERWRFSASDWVDSSPVIAPDGTIYVGSYDRRIYALHGAGAPASRYSPWPMFRRDAPHRAQSELTGATGQLVNLSTRAEAGGGENLIAGFVVGGSGEKPLLVRAAGPALSRFGVTGVLADPALELHATVDGRGTQLAFNENWSDQGRGPALSAAAAKTGAFPLENGSLDAALLSTVAPRAHSAVVRGGTSPAGIALVEVYDAATEDTATRLINLSTRAHVGVGDKALTPGFVVGGPGPLRLLIRAVGPSLAPLGVPGALARPTLTRFAKSGSLATNTGWGTAGAAADLRAVARDVGAFPLIENSADSALLVTVGPGAYTVRVSGVGDTVGEALVEVYVVP